MATQGWVAINTDEEADVYTERSEERASFLTAISRDFPATRLSPLIWALFQVAPVDQLRLYTECPAQWMLNAYNDDHRPLFEDLVEDALTVWGQRPVQRFDTSARQPQPFSSPFTSPKPPDKTASPSAPGRRTRSGKTYSEIGPKSPDSGREYSVRRDDNVAREAKVRDRGKCVVSLLGAVEACHLYPWSGFRHTRHKEVGHFWQLLSMFWPVDSREASNLIFADSRPRTPRGTETVANIISFCPTMHAYHTRGSFGLRPIQMSEDATKMELEFHWFHRARRQRRDRMDILDLPKSSRNLFKDDKDDVHPRYDPESITSDMLTSGTRFTISTHDPSTHPLPHPRLLNIQWHLQRLLAISGAAGWMDEKRDDD